MNLIKGTKVRQVVKAPIEGVVTGFDIDQETGVKQIKVEWEDPESNEVYSRFFSEADLEVVDQSAQ